MVDGADPLVRDPEGGAGAASCRPAHDDLGVRAALERLHEVPGVVVVVVGEVDPPDVVGLDEGEDVLEEGGAVGDHAGVDDDRLRGSDHERVHARRDRPAEGVLVGADEERLGRDLERLLSERGAVTTIAGALAGVLRPAGEAVERRDPSGRFVHDRVPVLDELLGGGHLCDARPSRGWW